MKTILLVDDKTDQLLLTKALLGGFGYTVVTACDAKEALTIFDPGFFDLVVTDNSMPGLSGEAMARMIKQRSPATPVLMLSGSAPADQNCLNAFLQKPVRIEVLREAVDRLAYQT